MPVTHQMMSRQEHISKINERGGHKVPWFHLALSPVPRTVLHPVDDGGLEGD